MPSAKAYHRPVGFPRCGCGVKSSRHYVEHAFVGEDINECNNCHLPKKQHRAHTRNFRKKPAIKYHSPPVYIGIDGEGQGRKEHRYMLLAASTIKGDRSWVASPADPQRERLTTEECLDLILMLPSENSKIFSYSFNYDLTKILTDLPNHALYALFRPELPSRKRRPEESYKGPLPIEWIGRNGRKYELNLQGTKFTVRHEKKRVVIWDLFKFFQSKFVQALKDWKVGDETLLAQMSEMKDKRSEFDKEKFSDVVTYCLSECKCIAELAMRLVEAHKSAGLLLKSYYGAGSSGGAMLDAMGIKAKLSASPPQMKEAIASAFFGGRFENSVIGAIREPLVNWDISSAYVYQLAFLPCLEHGSWTHTTKREDIENAQAQAGALVRYSLGPNPGIGNWGPFPFRTRDGSISFPIESGGGWIWLDEFLAGERIFPHVRFHEAWVYSANCNCKPFGQIPEYYNLRLKIGKEGPGIVIKLGMNSCYGKLAQSVGNAVFNSWIWAGMITSGCRAQLLTMLGLHEDPSNVLMMATDGLLTRETIVPPIPYDTGTGASGKPLGGWEKKLAPKGMFIARPGIYFPLNPTEDEIAAVRARGVGRSVVLKSWETIINAWERDGIAGYAEVANVSRFCGAKTSISVSANGKRYKRAAGTGSAPAYGQWISRKVALSFDPLPKRAGIHKNGRTLVLRTFPKELTSVPYDRAMLSNEAAEMQAAKQELIEQPDADLTEYEDAQS